MSLLDLVGWVGSAILVWSLLQTRIVRLRVINLVGCIILIVFNTLAGVWPMMGLNVGLAVINVYHLRKLLLARHSPAQYTVLAADPGEEYLRYLLRVHAADIAAFNPHFDADRTPFEQGYLILHEDETVGLVLLHDAEDGLAQIALDYVTPRFRDFTPGEFVFLRSDALADRGFLRVETMPGATAVPTVAAYYARLGFTGSGEVVGLDLT
ncbi:hypothetical protein SAMN05216410_0857 [Sanguibacter gelidistatuariae]|uniref:Inner membrane protein n=1 Tax=Sanguibacter gelidistatuariae TaxID=1814289 RepID=A0A1G6H9U0_9MICO|nr:hypothetical protein [Sanguibacter gelidistatuariae]SDB91032.1 hypothetical protein SAMN05216410_0857 [Sanguibacter gelidistatuariae]